MTIRGALFAVRLLINYAVDVDGAEDGSRSLISHYDHPVAAWRDEYVVHCWDRVFVSVRCPDYKWPEGHALHSFTHIGNHISDYIKNLPSRITCSPLNQTSKLRPTQSM